MYLSSSLIGLLQISLVNFVHADQHQVPLRSNPSDSTAIHRIAIIGAGAAGSSAAYHLAQYANVSGSEVPLDITIFDLNRRVGGRTTTTNALDDPRYPTEVGASIFVKINHILHNATRDFGLNVKDHSSCSTGSAYDLGIWDGTNFVFQIANDELSTSVVGRWKGWWDVAKLLWKYGLSPIRTQRLTKSTIGRFLSFYDDHFPFQSLDEVVEVTGLADFTGLSGEETLTAAGVSERFSREVIQASTRVNYAQNLGSIHGLETLVCMAIEGAMAVEGGNWQIFDQAVKRSEAKLHLDTAVTKVTKDENNRYHISTNTSSPTHGPFDTIILAAPYHQTNITFTPPLKIQPTKPDYVSLHVTLFTSPYRPSPKFFNLNPQDQDQVPDTILSTLPPGLDTGVSRGIHALGPSKFWSLSTLRVLEPERDMIPNHVSDEDIVRISKRIGNKQKSSLSVEEEEEEERTSLGKQYLYKIFSPEPISASFLEELFDLNSTSTSPSSPSSSSSSSSSSVYNSSKDSFEPISTLPKTAITWSYVKEWKSYPYLSPRTKFDAFRLDWNDNDNGEYDEDGDDANANANISTAGGGGAKGVWYTSSIEPFISTMETSALSGKNVARLIMDEIELLARS